MNLNDIVKLWYKTQMGNMHECKKNQFIFADIMWKLHENIQDEVFDVKKSLKDLTTFNADKDCDKYHEEQDDKAMEK